MDDTTKTRTFMRGKEKNAKAGELLALLKAEREINDSRDIPNTLTKRPLLPAIRRDENIGLYSDNETQNLPGTKSRFLWKDLDWEERWEKKERRNSELIAQSWFTSTENSTRNLPPLKTRKISHGIARPGCPEPPMTPCFDEN